MSVKRYSISELAHEFDVTPRTLRFYESQGILDPLREGTKRLFSERDRVRLLLVLRGKRLGLCLEEITKILDMYDSEEGEEGQIKYVLKRIQEECDALEQKRTEINNALAQLHHTAAQCIMGLTAKYSATNIKPAIVLSDEPSDSANSGTGGGLPSGVSCCVSSL